MIVAPILPASRLRAATWALSLLLASTPLDAPAQERNQMPEGSEAEALRQAYANLIGGEYGAAKSSYDGIAVRFRDTAAEPVARRGALVAEILRWSSQDSAEGEGNEATLARLRSHKLSQSVGDLRDEGVIADVEAAYWLAFISTNGDLTELAAMSDFAFLDPDAFTSAVLAAAPR